MLRAKDWLELNRHVFSRLAAIFLTSSQSTSPNMSLSILSAKRALPSERCTIVGSAFEEKGQCCIKGKLILSQEAMINMYTGLTRPRLHSVGFKQCHAPVYFAWSQGPLGRPGRVFSGWPARPVKQSAVIIITARNARLLVSTAVVQAAAMAPAAAPAAVVAARVAAAAAGTAEMAAAPASATHRQ